jgi:carbon storage regulator CsrA
MSGEEILVTIHEIRGTIVRLRIQAPDSVHIVRAELEQREEQT